MHCYKTVAYSGLPSVNSLLYSQNNTVFYVFQNCCSITVVPISPPLLFPAIPNPPLPHSILPTIDLVHGSCIHVPWLDPSPSPHDPPPPSLLVTVSLFYISMSLVLFCPLVCFVHYVLLLIGQIICDLSFTAWLISLCSTFFNQLLF